MLVALSTLTSDQAQATAKTTLQSSNSLTTMQPTVRHNSASPAVT